MGGYVRAQSVGTGITPEILLPIIYNMKLGSQFFGATFYKIANIPNVHKKAAMLAVLFAGRELIIRTGDLPTNMTYGGMIATFCQYIASCSTSNNFLFIYIGSKRFNLTGMLDAQVNTILTLLIVGVLYCIVILVRCIKKLAKLEKRFLIRFYKKIYKKFKKLKLKKKLKVLPKIIPLE